MGGHGSFCPEDKDTRALWGCDTESTDPQYSVDCNCGSNPKCSFCNGAGEFSYDRCPLYVVNERRDITFVLSCYFDLKSEIILSAGGLIDQSALWVKAHRVIRSEVASIDRDRQPKK